ISGGWLTYGGTGNKYSDFNPSVLAAPVAALVGGYSGQSQALQDSFYHMNRYTKYSLEHRSSAENTDKKSLTAHKPAMPETASSMWIKPYGGHEKVDLKNGTEVSNTTYGMLYGADTDLEDFGNGYKAIISAFIGYNGSHQSYDNVKINQHGGIIGLTGTMYKENFFTGITVSAGASSGKASTSYGREKFTVLTSGIANRTGYNFEFANGKLIVQPSVFMAYTSTNVSDYTNAAGVKIKSSSLDAFQIAPGVEVIGNFKNNWQPYFGISTMFNIMDKTDFTANETKLPDMSVKPYIQYGAGVQKSWGNQYTAFVQTILRHGGRDGVGLQAGFRWNFD
ncbi:MAG: autotransporter outer membrane beta-barrel domain-containing protein, partial [Alphaproteobacteria bacterium]|nr:autotransporter outer membrane beta-barrel domain-containing protein [Alphaproteobacteria bacterium]